MLITGRRSLTTVLRLILDFILVLNLLTLILLPFILDALYRDPGILRQLDSSPALWPDETGLRSDYPSDLPPGSRPFYLVFLYASGLGTAWILTEGHFILRRLEKNQPFAKQQVGSFRRVALAFAWLTLVFAVKIIFYNTLLTMFCCGLFFVLALIGLVLSEVFLNAWQVKTENELTV